MSKLSKLDSVKSIVHKQKNAFENIAKKVGGVNFEREQVFAIQALKNNSFLCSIAYDNQDSLKMAVINVAATGLSLNPVKKQAYLVPRDGKVCLDISYLGMIQIALDVGAIKWAKAELVYEKDQFQQNGINEKPDHKFSPFEDRGKIIGAYCVAKTHDDEFLTTIMPIEDIFGIRDRSVAWRAYKAKKAKSCPWATDEEEMIKKTVIRRSYKSWPLTNTKRERFDAALKATDHDHEIIDVIPEEKKEASSKKKVNEKVLIIKEMLSVLEKTEKEAVAYASQVFNRKIDSIDDFTDVELGKFTALLKGPYEKILEEKVKNENSKEDSKSVRDV